MGQITTLKTNLNLYLLKTNNGQFYQDYINHRMIDYYRLALNQTVIHDFNNRDDNYLKEHYAGHKLILEIMIRHLKVGDLILLVGYQNKLIMIGEIHNINFTDIDDRYISVNWLKEVNLKEIDARIVQFLYKKPVFMEITELKDTILRTIYPLYKMEESYHIIIRINQKDNIMLRSLLGIQQLVYKETKETDLSIKIHLESPGIIEFISEHKEVITVIIHLIRLFKQFRDKSKPHPSKRELYEAYQHYGIEKLEIDFKEEDVEKIEIV